VRIHENTLQHKNLPDNCARRFGLPVFEVDERYSTTEARSQGAKDADAASACVIFGSISQKSERMNAALSTSTHKLCTNSFWRMLRSKLMPEAHLVGITSGGAWLAQALHQDLALPTALGICVVFLAP
jgi:hypothetical protein